MSTRLASLDTEQLARGAEVLGRAGVVTGAPKAILRLEGAVALAAATAAYIQLGGGWTLFLVLFLTPDLSMLGYLAGAKVGAATYNLGHSYLFPAALAVDGLVTGQHLPVLLCLIWVAHIGFDRLLGYGLKYPSAFGHTHLGLVGRPRARSHRSGRSA